MSTRKPGFDAIVGNPPFAGKNNVIGGNRAGYVDWLKTVHPESSGASDLVAHFYRRAFDLLRRDGTFGLIATNTIYQGDTRDTGLRWIRTHDGEIFSARRRLPWPGLAAVVVSVVHVIKGRWTSVRRLDEREVEHISAFLFHQGGDEAPKQLQANAARCYIGAYILGPGFTFDDREKERDAVNSLADREALIAKDPRNAERIFPFLGGEELNDDPEQKHHRYVIGFGEMTEEEARKWFDLMAIVEAKVKPERLQNNRDAYRRYWWQFAEKRTELSTALQQRARVLVVARVSRTCAFSFALANQVFSEKIVVFPEERDSFFAVLQSRAHEFWARLFSSTMKDDLQYTPSDCFETFPFPAGWEESAALASIGGEYHAFRAELMKRNGQGLTATYNRFHAPDEYDEEILKLRALHDAMDRAVLDAYGWRDLNASSAP